MANIFNRIATLFLQGSILLRLIYINIAVFLLLRIFAVVCQLAAQPQWLIDVLSAIELPSEPSLLLFRPWTLISYMFTQFDVMHILFNMLWLYWFGIIFLTVNTPKRVLALYILGGLGGALLYLIAYNTLPGLINVHASLIGASAAVIAIVVATAIMLPDYEIGLLLIGPVKLKWIAVATILIDFLSISGINAGGHISHIGGAAIGAIYALSLKRGIDITAPINKLFDQVANLLYRRTKLRSQHSDFSQSASNRSSYHPAIDDLDAILDKIKKSGYTSLSPDERKKLFDASSRMK